MKLVLEEIQGIKSKLPVLASAAGFEQQEINAVIQKHTERGNTLLKGLGQELGRMDKENKDMAKTSEGKKSVEYSIRKTTHGSFVRKLRFVLHFFLIPHFSFLVPLLPSSSSLFR
jgi:hypothetical protein